MAPPRQTARSQGLQAFPNPMSARSCTGSFKSCAPGGKGIHAMNDDFLHQIRKDPPPHYLARLKARLVLQDEKSPNPLRRTWLRNAFLLTLLGASGLAAALILTNIYHQASTSPASPAQALQVPETTTLAPVAS